MTAIAFPNLRPVPAPQFARIGTAVAGVSVLVALWLARKPLLEMLTLVRDRQGMIAYVQQFGPWAPGLLGTMIFLQTIITFIPGHAFLVTAGYLFGFTRGFLFSYAIVLAASQLSFFLVRTAARPLVCRLAPKGPLERWQKIADRQGFGFYLFAFLFPGFPSDLLSYVGGLSSIRPWPFFLASALGRMPCVVVMTLIGSHGLELPPAIWVGIALGSALLFVAWKARSGGVFESKLPAWARGLSA